MLSYLEQIGIWGIAVPTIYGLYKWPKLDYTLRVATVYFTLLFLGNVVSYLPSENNNWVFSVLYGVEAFFAAWIFGQYTVWEKYKKAMLLLAILMQVIIIYSFYTKVTLLDAVSGNYTKVILGLSVSYSGVAVFSKVKSNVNNSLSKDSYFILALAWFVGSILALINVLFREALWNYSIELANTFIAIINIINVVQLVLYTYALYVFKSR